MPRSVSQVRSTSDSHGVPVVYGVGGLGPPYPPPGTHGVLHLVGGVRVLVAGDRHFHAGDVVHADRPLHGRRGRLQPAGQGRRGHTAGDDGEGTPGVGDVQRVAVVVAGEDLADLLPQRVGAFVLRLGPLLLAGEQVGQAVGSLQAVAFLVDAGPQAEALGVGELGDGVRAVLAPAVASPLLGAQLAPAVMQLGVRTCSRN